MLLKKISLIKSRPFCRNCHALLPVLSFPSAMSRGLCAGLASARLLCWKNLFCLVDSMIPQRLSEEKSKIPVVWLPSLCSPACHSPSELDFCSDMSSFSFCLRFTYQKRLEPGDFSAEDKISLERSRSS